MVIAFAVQKFTRNATDIKDRHFVVVDRTGVLYASARRGRRGMEPRRRGDRRADGAAIPSRAGDVRRAGRAGRARSCPIASRKDELYAFVEIPADALDPAVERARALLLEPPGLPAAAGLDRQHGQPRDHEPPLPRGGDRSRAGHAADQAHRRRRSSGCCSATPAARSVPRRRVDRVRTVAIPVGMMMILLFSVMSAAPQL